MDVNVNFSNIISELRALGKEIPMKQLVAKILRSLTDKYEKANAIEEAFDHTPLKVEDLVGNLQTYKVKIQAREVHHQKEDNDLQSCYRE